MLTQKFRQLHSQSSHTGELPLRLKKKEDQGIMSTRRSTRATSRAASSRGASPAITEQDIPETPLSRRVGRRATSTTPLPQIGVRASNSYGTYSFAQPANLRAPAGAEQINNVLGGLLEPVLEEGTSTTNNSSSKFFFSTRSLPPDESF